MGLTATQDVARVTALGYSLHEAVRYVARRVIVEADHAASYSSVYLREVHRLMVATA